MLLRLDWSSYITVDATDVNRKELDVAVGPESGEGHITSNDQRTEAKQECRVMGIKPCPVFQFWTFLNLWQEHHN